MKIPTLFSSSKTASAQLAIPPDVVAWCRRNGCLAFDQSCRVQTLPLISFIGERLDVAIRAGAFEAGGVGLLNPVQEKAQLDRERRIELEDERKIRQGEMVTLSEVERDVWEASLLPLKQSLEAMPESVATLANPENPEHAKKVLTEWLEKMKAIILPSEPTTPSKP